MTGKIVLAFFLLAKCNVPVGTSPAIDFLSKFNRDVFMKDNEAVQQIGNIARI